MKKLFVVLLTFSCSLMAEQTLFDGNIYHSGGYGGATLKFTQMGPNDDFGFLMGGQGGWIINHKYILGGGGWGLTNDIDVDWTTTPFDSRVEMGYGGLYFAYLRDSDAVLHTVFDVLVGWGAAGVSEKRGDRWNDQYDEMWYDDDAFFVVEPGISLEMNLFQWMRIAGGVSYRYIQGVDLYGLSDENLSGISGVVQFKFGSF